MKKLLLSTLFLSTFSFSAVADCSIAMNMYYSKLKPILSSDFPGYVEGGYEIFPKVDFEVSGPDGLISGLSISPKSIRSVDNVIRATHLLELEKKIQLDGRFLDVKLSYEIKNEFNAQTCERIPKVDDITLGPVTHETFEFLVSRNINYVPEGMNIDVTLGNRLLGSISSHQLEEIIEDEGGNYFSDNHKYNQKFELDLAERNAAFCAVYGQLKIQTGKVGNVKTTSLPVTKALTCKGAIKKLIKKYI